MRNRLAAGLVGVMWVGGCNGPELVEGTLIGETTGTGSTSTATTTSTVPTTGSPTTGTETGDATDGITGDLTTSTTGSTTETPTTGAVSATESTTEEPSTDGESTTDASTSTGNPSTGTSTGTDTGDTSTGTSTSTGTDTGDTSTGAPDPVCGDGLVGEGEACDDGDDNDANACTNVCAFAVCGDGIVEVGVDGCDDMNAVNNDVCSNKCVVTPTAVTLAAGTNTAQVGNPNGGTAFNEACPPGSALIGFEGSLNAYHRQIRGVCGLLGLTLKDPGFAVVTTDPVKLPEHGMFGNSPWTRTCPQDQVILGFSGRGGGLVDALTFTCVPLLVSEAGDGTWSLAIGADTNLPAIGGNGGQPFPQTNCPKGQVATQQRLRAGDGLDAFGLGCSTFGLAY